MVRGFSRGKRKILCSTDINLFLALLLKRVKDWALFSQY
jgi:hypothetical protein